MNTYVKVLNKYAETFRDLVNAKNWSTDEHIKEALGLNKPGDWGFICTAMDIVSDASLAIENFLRFSLDGPTKYNENGDKYLRLYGVLNATFMQQNALYNLYKLNNVPDPNKIRERIKALRIRAVRHKLGSHSNDYCNPDTGIRESYIPIRASLSGFKCTLMNNETLETEEVDLEDSLEKHLELMIEIADMVYEKSIKTFYGSNQKKSDAELQKLSDLRVEKDGGLVIRMEGDNSDFVLRILRPRNQPEFSEGNEDDGSPSSNDGPGAG